MKLSDLSVGSLVKAGAVYNGEEIIWRVLEHGHSGDPSGTTALECRDIITLKCFDAKEPNNSDSDRQQYGNNRYLYSNLLQWLNSDAAAYAWYSAQHAADQEPNSANVWQQYSGTGTNPYSAYAGFLSYFSADLKAALQTVTKITAKNTVTDGSGYEIVSSKIFLLSTTEVGLANENSVAEGSIYAYYYADNQNSRRVKVTATDGTKGNYSGGPTNGKAWSWWLRTPNSDNSYSVRLAYKDGSLYEDEAYKGHRGVSPAMCISSDIEVKGPDANNIYTIKYYPSVKIIGDTITSGQTITTYNYTVKSDKTRARAIPFTIKKNSTPLIVNNNNISLTASSPSADVTFTNNSGQTITVSSSNTNVATIAKKSGNTYTITAGSTSGSTTITATVPESSNYSAGSVTIDVTVTLKPTQVTWASGTDAQIAAILDAYYNGTLTASEIQNDYGWTVGMERSVSLNAINATGVGESHRAQTVKMVILDFEHDDLSSAQKTSLGTSRTKALITVQTKDCLRDANVADDGGSSNTEHGYMNSSNTNNGGWTSCARRTWCNSVFYTNALPTAFKNMVKEVNKLTSAGNQSSTINTDQDKVFLLSEIEIFGTTSYSKSGEGTQYSYFTTASNRYKLPKWISSRVSDSWWERSPRAISSNAFCFVSNDGNATGYSASHAYGLAPACAL